MSFKVRPEMCIAAFSLIKYPRDIIQALLFIQQECGFCDADHSVSVMQMS